LQGTMALMWHNSAESRWLSGPFLINEYSLKYLAKMR
jgi:hypothetical protein